eukprot:1888730-Prymnesium_polylepis.1
MHRLRRDGQLLLGARGRPRGRDAQAGVAVWLARRPPHDAVRRAGDVDCRRSDHLAQRARRAVTRTRPRRRR